MRPDGVPQPCAQLLGELGGILVAHLGGRRPRVPLDARLAVLPHEQVAGRQLPRPAEDRVRRRDGVEREKRLERVRIDLAAGQSSELGRERELAAVLAVVERLDPEPVPSEHEPAAP